MRPYKQDGIVLSLEEARMASLDELRADIIHSAARGQGPTFIAAKLDLLIIKVKAAPNVGRARLTEE